MAETILSLPIFKEIILPFLLVFALIFAILERTKILGEGRRQVNAIIAFVIGLVFVSFSRAVLITVNLMAFVAVLAVIILVFMLLYGFASGEKEFSMPKGLKITFGILIGIALIVALLIFTGFWDKIFAAVLEGNNIVSNVVFIIIIGAAIAVVLAVGKGKE